MSGSRKLRRKVVVTHGYGGYTNGCSCQVCRGAKAAYMRARRTPGAITSSFTHGTIWGYQEHLCRCDACRGAKRAVDRRQAAERRESQNAAS
jgi:hypothetical protein